MTQSLKFPRSDADWMTALRFFAEAQQLITSEVTRSVYEVLSRHQKLHFRACLSQQRLIMVLTAFARSHEAR